jgi:hypothetical protein
MALPCHNCGRPMRRRCAGGTCCTRRWRRSGTCRWRTRTYSSSRTSAPQINALKVFSNYYALEIKRSLAQQFRINRYSKAVSVTLYSYSRLMCLCWNAQFSVNECRSRGPLSANAVGSYFKGSVY